MCTFSQTSSQGSDPGTTAGLNFMMGAGKSIGGWMTSRSNAKAHNRALLKNYKYDIAQWNNKYDRDVIGWKNDNIDESLKVEGEWQQSMERLADSDLQIYDAIGKSKLATQAAYAQMLSTGTGEQTGRRAGGTTKKAAIQALGQKMAEIRNRLTQVKDAGSSYQRGVRNQMLRRAHQQNIDVFTSRPVQGFAPRFKGELKAVPGIGSLVSGLAGNYLDSQKVFDDLKAPTTIDDPEAYKSQFTGNTYDTSTTETPIPFENIATSDIPPSGLEAFTQDKAQTAWSNQASWNLGSGNVAAGFGSKTDNTPFLPGNTK